MSVRLGERWIRLSTTVALNRIRKSEEMEKGWRKNEIALPVEFRDLDPVHVVPMKRVIFGYSCKQFSSEINPLQKDMGRLMLILMTRSIDLSNTQYSLLLEAGGKFLTLGSEWIGSLVKYKERSICYSKLFAQDDPFYTDQTGNNNDECEYFGNGIINNERFFIQNYVFDATFEIKFNFGEDCLSYGNLTTEFNS